MASLEPRRPSKRPRLHHQPSIPKHTPSDTRLNDTCVKREPSPTPPPPQPKLVTSGTKRYAPFPPNCLPQNPRYKHNRRLWARDCRIQLEGLKLTVEKLLIRDDGIIIDWKSQVPVWSDNLKPAEHDLAAAITQTHHANAQQRPGSLPNTPLRPKSILVLDPDPADDTPTSPVKSLPVPPRPRRTVTCPPVSSVPAAEGSADAPPIPVPQTAEAPTPSIPSTAPSEPLTVKIVPEEEEKMSKLTMKYLERYFQTFDSDRANLASAYSGNASFSYRQVKCSSPRRRSLVPPSDVNVKHDRLEITAALLSLPPLQLLPLNGSEAYIDYDMMWLGAPVGMFVTCRGAHHADSSKLAVTHSFLLRCKEVYEEDARADGVWPLVAVAHQLIVFDR